MTSPSKSGHTLRIGVDIGGTFTDIVAVRDDGAIFVEKILSSVGDYSIAIAEGIGALLKRAGLAAAAVKEVVHGTTVATNAILEGKGARTGLITTRGFRDILDIRNSRRPEMYSINWVKPPVLVERYLRCEVEERLDSRGRVVRALDVDSAKKAIDRLVAQKVESIAVCLLNSFANPAHEQAVLKQLQERAPGVSISLSSEVVPEAKEYERTSTTCINAFVRPVVERYLDNLVKRLRGMGIDAPLLTMQSNGGTMSARAAQEKPIHIIESGPAAGVIGGLHLAKKLGHAKAITFDMGGTTAKASLIEDGEIRLTANLEVGAGLSAVNRLSTGGGYALSTPSVDVAEVGVGGGSIAWIDESRAIHVGPHSAGAKPGPVCYDLGGDKPTVTDANLLLGYLNSGHLVGGNLKLNFAGAQDVVRKTIAAPLGMSIEEAAFGIHTVANANMTRAIRAISTERGRDPRDAVLIAFGGNGPVHAAELARTLGMKRVVIPQAPGVFSAFGLLESDIEHDYVKAFLCDVDPSEAKAFNTAMAALRQSAEQDIRDAGYGAVKIDWSARVDIRYRGQASQLNIKAAAGNFDAAALKALRADFEAEHERTFGYRSPAEGVEVVNLRLFARVDAGRHAAASGPASSGGKAESAGKRRAYFGSKHGFVETSVYARAALKTAKVVGPAIIEQYDSTVVLPPGTEAAADAAGNLIIDILSEARAESVDQKFDPVTRELVRHSLESLADEMAFTLIRTCRSGHVKHSGDFSTAIADAKGRLLAQGLTLPFHLGALPDALAAVLATHGNDVSEGDVFVLNDPFGGGMHLPDVFIIKPIFHGGGMVALAAAIVHQVDIGGRVAGGNSTLNSEIYAEGLRLPLLKLYEGGVANEAVFKIIRANVRVPHKVEGDIRAQLAACRRGERDYLAMVERFGIDNLERYQEQLLDASEALSRETIRAIPDGTYKFEDYLDGDSLDPDPVKLCVAMTVKGDEVTIDCAGSAPQVRGGINSTLSVTKSMAYTALRCLMPAHASSNAGYMRPISVLAEPGTVLNGVLPAAGAGRAATAYRLMDVIFGALAKALPGRIMAAGEGSPLMHTIFGRDENGKPFVFVDLMRGSWGARPTADGLDATALACSTGSAVPGEIVELEHPVRLEHYGYITDSCGAGTYRGGMATLREYRALVDSTVQYRSERRKFRPYGLVGGHPGSASIVILDPDGSAQLLPEKGEVRLKKGQTIRFCQAGGGGYGDPLARDAGQVARDVRDELISAEAAHAKYGVVITAETGAVDRTETELLRKSRRGPAHPAAQVDVVRVTQPDIDFMVDAAARMRSL